MRGAEDLPRHSPSTTAIDQWLDTHAEILNG